MHAILDRAVEATLRRAPERCTSLGLTEARTGYRFIDKLSDASKAANRAARAETQAALNDLRVMNRDWLEPRERVTYDVVATAWENSLANSAFEVGNGAGSPYIVTQLTGAYRNTPDFLDNQHPLRTRDEADGFLGRLDAYVRNLDEETAIIREDAAAGVIPPDFAIDRTLTQMDAFTSTPAAQNLLVQTLVRRLPQTAELTDARRLH